MNAYFQYFTGKQVQQWGQPCVSSDLLHFCQREIESVVKKILKHSIDKHSKDGKDKHVSIDSTAKEKNVAYPTDAKQHKKIIDKYVKQANKLDITLRRSYKRISIQSVKDTYNGKHPKRRKRSNC